MSVYIGVDPGTTGGLVALTQQPSGSVWERFTSMPRTERGIWDWFDTPLFQGSVGPVIAVIEQVSGYLGEAQPGSAMFKFGASYGGLRMALVAAGIPFAAVRPQVWQKLLGIKPRRKKENRTAWKNRLKSEAERLFPDLKITLATADALLIAYYCRKVYGEGS